MVNKMKEKKDLDSGKKEGIKTNSSINLESKNSTNYTAHNSKISKTNENNETYKSTKKIINKKTTPLKINSLPKEATKETAKETTPKTTKEPAKDITKEATKETAKETTPKATKDPAKDITKEATKETAKETTPKATKEPANNNSSKNQKKYPLKKIIIYVLIIAVIFALLSYWQGNPFEKSKHNFSAKYDYMITATQGDIISLKTIDPFNGFDIIYSDPFDNYGIWITSTNDKGEYISNITLKNGNETIKKTIYIEINPQISKNSIIAPKKLIGKEGQTLAFGVSIKDSLNTKNLSNQVKVTNLPENARYEQGFVIWDVGYGTIKKNLFTKLIQFMGIDYPASKSFNIEFEYLLEKTKTQITIYDTNQAPIFPEKILEINAKESKNQISIPKTAIDYDGDFLNYQLYDLEGRMQKSTTFTPSKNANYELRVSDGLKEASQLIKIKITPDEKPIEEIAIPKIINLKEGQLVQIKAVLSNKVQIQKISSKDLPEFIKISGEYLIFDPDYNIASKQEPQKSFNITLEINYNKSSQNNNEQTEKLIKEISIIVSDKNQAPLISNFNPESVFDTLIDNPINFSIEAKDPDGDKLYYIWELGKHNEKITDTSSVYYLFSTTGEKLITVHITDGTDTIKKQWIVDVWEYESYKLLYPTSDLTKPINYDQEESSDKKPIENNNDLISNNDTKITWIPKTLIFYT